ncbi:MAG: hypothetical protein HZB67_05175 [Candidatus Aenigmarchaeota archaeon]|nr:hypothetical protein [Candidatus Aenigmarchaeota archaeon]
MVISPTMDKSNIEISYRGPTFLLVKDVTYPIAHPSKWCKTPEEVVAHIGKNYSRGEYKLTFALGRHHTDIEHDILKGLGYENSKKR